MSSIGAPVDAEDGRAGLEGVDDRFRLERRGLAPAIAQAHGHLSPADVDAGLEQIVRHAVEDRRDLQLADAEDAHDAHDDVREEAVGVASPAATPAHIGSNS